MSGLFIAGAAILFLCTCATVTNDRMPADQRLPVVLVDLFILSLLVLGAISL